MWTGFLKPALRSFRPVWAKGILKNNLTFWTPILPAQMSGENSFYPDIPAFSRLVGRAPHRP
jgi:hypothetical protein